MKLISSKYFITSGILFEILKIWYLKLLKNVFGNFRISDI
ncbi:Protein CBG25609 [Caenorhabditis briggsae]|uniref:Protein CBG25609 n=1 Tax=Caenorhabditis briggsae TaxID=6238 RepID=B6IF94_CAEBR|nr:Protein CBG25609 [Caenorhabditis briggsae]CAR98574.1 Protein CBG25609 [Caenorhabditis briggsae]